MPKALITDADFGPAMRRLNVEEQMFVCNLFMGHKSLTKAAELSGITALTRAALRVKAHRLLRDARISEAVREESKRRTTLLLPKAQKALEGVLDNPQHADHFKAIKVVRDDGGVSRVVERVLNVNVSVTDQEKLERIKLFAKNHGIDPKKFLGYDPNEVKEAEFEELTPEQIAEEEELGLR